jgi:hypothetical protein
MTLADYLRELRAHSFPYPKLGKAAIQSASSEQLSKWLSERKQFSGKNMDVSEMRRALSRFDASMKPMTQREIADKAGVSLFLINKVFTSGKKIRGTGLKQILRALGCEPNSQDYRKALSIWANESGMQVGLEDVDELVSEKQEELSVWWRRVSPHLVKMSKGEREQIALMMTRPAVIAALPSLNAVFDSKR